MTQRVRLAVRYLADFAVRLHGGPWEQPTRFRARDVSRGGVFVITEKSPEIFTGLRLTVELPWGGELQLAARVVHIEGIERARVHGGEAGIGVEFLDPDPDQKELILQLVQWARERTAAVRVPVRTLKANPVYLNPMQRYLLEAVDGQRSTEEIGERLQLETNAAHAVLQTLNEINLVSFQTIGSAATPQAPRVSARPTCPAPDVLNPSLCDALRARAEPVIPEPVVASPLSKEQVAAFDAFLERVAGNHYQVLQVSPTATQAQIREAYLVQNDRFCAKGLKDLSLGDYRDKLRGGCDRLREAYRVLSHATMRQEYDAYLRASFVDSTSRAVAPDGAPVATEATEDAPAEPQPQVVSFRGRALASRTADPIVTRLRQASRAAAQGDMQQAARLLDLLGALQWDRPYLRKVYEDLEQKVTVALVDSYEERARYEIKQQRWKQGARSWMKVCRARPTDPVCHRQVAEALLMCPDQLHAARKFAQRAVELAPSDPFTRRVLGHVYMAAGLHLNARRELEAAAALSGIENVIPNSAPGNPTAAHAAGSRAEQHAARATA